MKKNRILHLFQWRLKDIENNLEVISNQGFNMIQISPIQPLKEYTNVWWTLYQPCGFTIGNNWIGSKKDLISLCNKAKIFIAIFDYIIIFINCFINIKNSLC